MENKILKLFGLIFGIVILFSLIQGVSALVIESVNQDTLYPGSEARIEINLNNPDSLVEDISFGLDYSKTTLFTPVGASERTLEELDEDEDERFSFSIKASNSVSPGDYSIPYALSYYENSSNASKVTKTGTIGITVNSETKLDFIGSTDNPVIGAKGKINLKIINKGFGEVKFLSVSVQPSGYTLLSEDSVYVGSISSDDFDIASFNVIFTKKNPVLNAFISYKDFENNDKTQEVSIDLRAYSSEEAIRLGFSKPSKLPLIIGIMIVVAIILLIRRIIKKRKKKINGGLK